MPGLKTFFKTPADALTSFVSCFDLSIGPGTLDPAQYQTTNPEIDLRESVCPSSKVVLLPTGFMDRSANADVQFYRWDDAGLCWVYQTSASITFPDGGPDLGGLCQPVVVSNLPPALYQLVVDSVINGTSATVIYEAHTNI